MDPDTQGSVHIRLTDLQSPTHCGAQARGQAPKSCHLQLPPCYEQEPTKKPALRPRRRTAAQQKRSRDQNHGHHLQRENPCQNPSWDMGYLHNPQVQPRTSPVLQLPKVRAPQITMLPAAPNLRRLQWQTPYRPLSSRSQCREANQAKMPKLQGRPSCMESPLPGETKENPYLSTKISSPPSGATTGQTSISSCSEASKATKEQKAATCSGSQNSNSKSWHKSQGNSPQKGEPRAQLAPSHPNSGTRVLGIKPSGPTRCNPRDVAHPLNSNSIHPYPHFNSHPTRGQAPTTTQPSSLLPTRERAHAHPNRSRTQKLASGLCHRSCPTTTGRPTNSSSRSATPQCHLQAGANPQGANPCINTQGTQGHILGLGHSPRGDTSGSEPNRGQLSSTTKPQGSEAQQTQARDPANGGLNRQSPTNNLKILQLNIHSVRSKFASLDAAIKQDKYDIIILQETLVNKFSYSGFQTFTLPCNQENRGLLTLVRSTIPATPINPPIPCGEGVETLAVKVQLLNQTLNVYNIYKQQEGYLELGELFALAANEPTFFGGDFNSHHPILSSPSTTNEAGEHIAHLLEEETNVALLNNGEATHIRGGRLDLAFLSSWLRDQASWDIHPTLMSDHYATCTSLQLQPLPPPPPPPARWNQEKADWNKFQQSLTLWFSNYAPPQNINQLEADITAAFHAAADASMPKTKGAKQHYKDSWYYSSEVKALKNRINRARKLYRKRPCLENRELLQLISRDVHQALATIKTNKWLEWCSQLNQHTSLSQLWQSLKRVAGKKFNKTPTHPQPQLEAERLATNFAERSATTQLPQCTRLKQEQLAPERWNAINTACTQHDTTDTPFQIQELRAIKYKGKDTSPGADQITYSMIKNMGESGEKAYLLLLNTTWSQHQRPQVWNQQDTQPIPKPKEPNSYRPISLLSCLEKTAEKMVLARLQHKIGPLHPNLYAFREGTGTTECITDVLSCINNQPALVVFLDLEKAFELASSAAILYSLVQKGVKGHLLAWLKNYTQDRQSRVRFQGHVSTYKTHENGTPQGGILSPLLFNILMEDLAKLQLPNLVEIFIFADDIAIVARGPHKLTNTQKALNTISNKCTELGLKINSNKTKAMAIKTPKPNTPLMLSNQPIEWVNHFMYLGVYLDKQLNFQEEIKYLRQKAASRLAPMRYMCSLEQGAGFHIQKAYYMATTRSLIDYGAPTLANINQKQISSLEVLQNNAMRLMLGAPMWTRICNLQMEANIPPLASRIEVRNTQIAAKALLSSRPSITQKRLKEELTRHTDLPIPNTYAAHIGNNIRSCKVATQLQLIKPDKLDESYQPKAPWEPFPAKISYTMLPASKNACSAETLLQAAHKSIREAEIHGGTSYYTDGSVDPSTHTAGAAVYSSHFSASWRTANTCSTLQTELLAIQQTLKYSISNGEGPVIIHTDSRSSLQTLQKASITENKLLISSTLALIQQHHLQGRPVTLNWIPSHIGIEGNEKADHLASQALLAEAPQIYIQPSLQQYKGMAKPAQTRAQLKNFKYWLTNNSPSASWYNQATQLNPLPISKGTPRKLAVILARLRLGYKCNWEVIEPRNMDCKHCYQSTNLPLFHYLLECPNTAQLRAGNNFTPSQPEAFERAIKIVQDITNDVDKFKGTLMEFPPPR